MNTPMPSTAPGSAPREADARPRGEQKLELKTLLRKCVLLPRNCARGNA